MDRPKRRKTPWISGFLGRSPRIDPSAFVDISARVIGDVQIEEEASLWPMVVVRADSSSVLIGRRAAILDLALLEAPENYPVTIGPGALISHGAIIHGARVEGSALVGINAIVLDGAVVSAGSMVGAGSLVTAGTHIPPNSLVFGSPARIIRETTVEERAVIQRQVDELLVKSAAYRSTVL